MTIKIVCISDTHTMHSQVSLPMGDILIHAGDATYRGYEKEVREFSAWMHSLPHMHKVYVAGNHDTSFEDQPKDAKKWFFDIAEGNKLNNTYYIQDELLEVEVDGRKVKIYGSPWQPEFFNWAFNLPRGEKLKEKWNLIPYKVDILVTHGPPYRLCDQVTRTGEHVGCRELRAEIQKKIPKLHVCGHIHEGYGTDTFGKTIVANASVCTAGYKPVNAPLVFEMDDTGKITQIIV